MPSLAGLGQELVSEKPLVVPSFRDPDLTKMAQFVGETYFRQKNENRRLFKILSFNLTILDNQIQNQGQLLSSLHGLIVDEKQAEMKQQLDKVRENTDRIILSEIQPRRKKQISDSIKAIIKIPPSAWAKGSGLIAGLGGVLYIIYMLLSYTGK